jgi:hypothetical protein
MTAEHAGMPKGITTGGAEAARASIATAGERMACAGTAIYHPCVLAVGSEGRETNRWAIVRTVHTAKQIHRQRGAAADFV